MTVDRTALVTGAGTGIGCAVALELAARGDRLVLVGRTRETLERVAKAIDAGGGEAVVVDADVTDVASVDAIDEVATTVDILINNAAAYAGFALVEDGSDEEFDDVHATVVGGARRLIRHVVPGMKSRGFGRIVNVGSLAAELGGPGQAAYAAAKAGLIGLTRTVALESARFGVTVNLVQPGLIDTDRIDRAVDEAVRERLIRNIPARRIGTPDEIAHAVAFLTSEQASYITGALVPVSGGLGLGLFAGGAS